VPIHLIQNDGFLEIDGHDQPVGIALDVEHHAFRRHDTGCRVAVADVGGIRTPSGFCFGEPGVQGGLNGLLILMPGQWVDERAQRSAGKMGAIGTRTLKGRVLPWRARPFLSSCGRATTFGSRRTICMALKSKRPATGASRGRKKTSLSFTRKLHAADASTVKKSSERREAVETIEARLERKAAVADTGTFATESLGQMTREQRHKLLYGD
jgi:hypothetical protein